MLYGNFVALLLIDGKYRKRLKDIDNRLKAPLDYCVRIGVIEDDSLLDIGTCMWSTPDVVSESGCRIILWGMDGG